MTNTASEVNCFERHQNHLYASTLVGLLKKLSPFSVTYQLEGSTNDNLAGMHQLFLSVVKISSQLGI